MALVILQIGDGKCHFKNSNKNNFYPSPFFDMYTHNKLSIEAHFTFSSISIFTKQCSKKKEKSKKKATVDSPLPQKKAMVKSESGRGRDQTQNKLSEYNKFLAKTME